MSPKRRLTFSWLHGVISQKFVFLVRALTTTLPRSRQYYYYCYSVRRGGDATCCVLRQNVLAGLVAAELPTLATDDRRSSCVQQTNLAHSACSERPRLRGRPPLANRDGPMTARMDRKGMGRKRRPAV
jgi:hypothetical protein